MTQPSTTRIRVGMHTSPWVILSSTIILLVVVMVLAIQNTNRERRHMAELLSAEGAALIRAVEAGARTGMLGMKWGGQQIQRLLEETGRLPDVLYMAVIDSEAKVVAHSDPSRIGGPFDPGRQITHLGPDEQENWELVSSDQGQRIFEVHRHFRPLTFRGKDAVGQMQAMMQGRGRMAGASEDWFSTPQRERLLIIVGLDVTPFEEAIRSDIRTTVVLSVVMLLLGFGGFVSLFWMHSYRAARKSLQDTSAFADEVVSRLPVGLIATDRSGRITFFNGAAEKITGLSGMRVRNRFPHTFLPPALCSLQKILAGETGITEREMECAFSDNRRVPVSVSATRIDNEAGEFVGQVMILRDLSEIRRLQQEIRSQEKLAAMGGLAAGVAHEVRNPLSSIKALATFFAGQFADGSEAREAAGVMVREVDRLNRVITELLEFARPSDLSREPLDMGLLLSRSIRLIQQDAANKNVLIDLQTGDGVCPAWVDPDRLAQCLLNLYVNAIQAMETGGTLTVRCFSMSGDTLGITVSDTGRGIAPEDLNRIFEPYFTTKPKGTGLGLAIVYKIVEAHQGHIEVQSAMDQGTSFTIMLPCHPPRTQKE